MKLPAIPFLTKTFTTEYFLSLIFELDKVSSILFKEQEKTLHIVATHETPLDLEDASSEDLVVASDTVISKLEMSLPQGANLEKTIFAVPYSWVEDGKIKSERLTQLKKISTELALTPMGFIISIEAIIAFLQRKEGAPVSGIFVELSEKTLTVFIVRSGNVIDVKRGTIEEGVEKTVERLLGTVTKLDVLPSKIILLHNKEAEAVSQKFLSHHWTKELSFMHLPQVAILERGFENEAIINGVASQLNVIVKDDVDVSTSEEVYDSEPPQIDDSEGFGFVMDKDIAEKDETEETVGGFMEQKEIEEEPVVRHHGVEEKGDGVGEEMYEDDEPEVEKKGIVSGIVGSLAAFFTPESFARIPRIFGHGRKLLIPFIALVIVILVIAAYYSLHLKATVVIFTDQKAISEDSLDISLATSGNSSFTDKILRISTANEEVSGEESIETTGQKDTGEKAKGSVTIFNKSESPKQLDKGSTIVSSNNLEFTLDDSVNIASTSSFSTSFSSVKANVTASNFGKEYNIPSQTNFTIKGVSASDVFAKNDAAFSGGTKEEIQVVARKDLQTLESTAIKNFFDDAKKKAENKLSQNDALIPVYLSADFSEETYDKKVDDEASAVKLTATIDYTLGIYKKDELSEFISSSDEFDVPEEFTLDDKESSITMTDIKRDGEDISAKLSFNAIFKPKLEIKDIPQQISGMGQDAAIEKLKASNGVADVSIQFTNKIAFLPLLVPLNKDNITIEFKAQ